MMCASNGLSSIKVGKSVQQALQSLYVWSERCYSKVDEAWQVSKLTDVLNRKFNIDGANSIGSTGCPYMAVPLRQPSH
jgi:hypothetical protein